MKNFILTTILMLLFGACTKEYYTEEYYTEENYNVNSKTIPYTVFTSTSKEFHWKVAEDDTGFYFYCDIAVPELTQEVFDFGLMNAYLSYKLDNKLRLAPLPFSDFRIDTGYQWEEQLSVEFSVGHVTFILKYDDHDVKQSPLYDPYDFVVRFYW